MLGHKLVQQLKKDFDVWATVRGKFAEIEKYGFFRPQNIFENVDVNNAETLENVFKKVQPQVVINAAGIIKQLPISKDIVKTLSVNSIFPHRLREMAEAVNARLITIGTDCVFSGTKGNYNEREIPDALDLYGQSKHFGELDGENSLTLRTSIIGRELTTVNSLVEWFLSNRGKQVKGFINALYSGFTTNYLAEILTEVIIKHRNLSGLYHVSSEVIDKYSLLQLLKKSYKIDIEIEPFEDFYIDRSLNSAKFRNITGWQPPTWEKMIWQMADDPTPYHLWK